MTESPYPIQLAARLTGLSTYVIRIWEQRYRAVEPRRTPSNRRLYSQREIERLSLLRDLVGAGHRIGQLARLPDPKLRRLANDSPGVEPAASSVAPAVAADASLTSKCLAAIQSLDARALREVLEEAGVTLGVQGMIQRVVGPLAQRMGDLWREGGITAAQEHFGTGILREALADLVKPFSASDKAPVLVVATPAGQLHELGALLAGAMAANLGWQLIQLGASLPAAEIAGAARGKGARAVALSLVYPEDDEKLPGELTMLRELMPPDTALLVGGRAMPAYRDVLQRIGAILAEDLVQFGLVLDRLRQPGRKATR